MSVIALNEILSSSTVCCKEKKMGSWNQNKALVSLHWNTLIIMLNIYRGLLDTESTFKKLFLPQLTGTREMAALVGVSCIMEQLS